MGCDIHCYLESRDEDGQWVGEHDGALGRDYTMFAHMAGVRDYIGIEPISEPRGLPCDVSKSAKNCHKDWGGDAHSASWLTKDELRQVQAALAEASSSNRGLNSLLSHMEDTDRLVFWFDN